jgi:hypothetical protein
VGLLALAATPLLSPRERAPKVLLTWLSPITLAAGTWDGFVSSLRMYSDDELRALVAPLGDHYRWHHGLYRYSVLGQGTYFYGLPRAANGG